MDLLFLKIKAQLNCQNGGKSLCQNGAKCRNVPLNKNYTNLIGFKCVCALGFTGVYCEIGNLEKEMRKNNRGFGIRSSG